MTNAHEENSNLYSIVREGLSDKEMFEETERQSHA